MLIRFMLVGLLAFFLASSAVAASFNVYTLNVKVEEIRLSTLKLLYTGRCKFCITDIPVKVVILPRKDRNQRLFLLSYIGISYTRMLEIALARPDAFILSKDKKAVHTALKKNHAIVVLNDAYLTVYSAQKLRKVDLVQ